MTFKISYPFVIYLYHFHMFYKGESHSPALGREVILLSYHTAGVPCLFVFFSQRVDTPPVRQLAQHRSWFADALLYIMYEPLC